MAEPNRGEVWLVDLGYAAKVRPCLVLSIPAEDRDRALVTVVAHTTSPRGSRFEVSVDTQFLRVGVFRRAEPRHDPAVEDDPRLGELSGEGLASVELAVQDWLGLL